MFKLVKCGHPHLRLIIVDKRRHNNLSDLKVLKVKGVRVCKWCFKAPLDSPRRHYCSEKCKSSAGILMAPQSREGAIYLLLRQRFNCAGCNYSWKEFFRDVISSNKKSTSKPMLTAFSFARYLNGINYDPGPFEYFGIRNHRGCQVDHIIPIWEGGDTFGLDNVQALCVQCHQKKSAQETRRRSGTEKIFYQSRND